jgi:hypothetical protein
MWNTVMDEASLLAQGGTSSSPHEPALSSATNCRDRSLASSIHVDEQVKGANEESDT